MINEDEEPKLKKLANHRLLEMLHFWAKFQGSACCKYTKTIWSVVKWKNISGWICWNIYAVIFQSRRVIYTCMQE